MTEARIHYWLEGKPQTGQDTGGEELGPTFPWGRGRQY